MVQSNFISRVLETGLTDGEQVFEQRLGIPPNMRSIMIGDSVTYRTAGPCKYPKSSTNRYQLSGRIVQIYGQKTETLIRVGLWT